MSTPETRTPEPPEGEPGAPSPAENLDERPRPRRRWLLVGLIAAGALILYLVFGRSSRHASDETTTGPAAGKGAPARTIPVIAAPARSGDLPVVLVGLGTVTALNTVTVRSRVDGQLLSVNFKEGELVHAGDLIAQIDPRPFEVQLTQAKGQEAKDQAALQNARADLARFESVTADGVFSQQQLDTQRATVRQFEASIESDRGLIDAAKLNITYSRVTAPIGGRVGLRLVDVGNIVHAADASGLVVITQLEPITVVFSLPADRLPQLLAPFRAGKSLPVVAFDRDMTKRLAEGVLAAVDNQIDATTGTVKLKATFPNRDGALFPNQFVNASLLVDTLKNAVLVPAAAIQRSPQSTYVWRVKPDSTVEMRDVEVALTEGDTSAIRKGLAAGDSVVVDGVDKLQPGTHVTASSGHAGATHPAPEAGSASPASDSAAPPPARGAPAKR